MTAAPTPPPRLPEELERLLDEVLRETRLHAAELGRLRDDLREHLLDGLDSGTPLSTLVDRLGRPEDVGPLLREGIRVAEPAGWGLCRVIRRAALAQTAVLAVVYGISAVRLLVGPPPGGPRDDLRRVPTSIASARSALETGDLRGAFSAAAALHRRGGLPGELAGLILMDRVLRVADSVGPGGLSEEMLHGTPVRFERERVRAALPSFISRLYRPDGGLGREGLMLLANLKGIDQPSAGALLLAPVYFAAPAGESETMELITGALGGRSSAALPRGPREIVAATVVASVMAAEQAAARLEARLYPPADRVERLDEPSHLVRAQLR